MKLLYYFVAVLFLVSEYAAQMKYTQPIATLLKTENFIQFRCLKNADNNVLKEVEDAAGRFVNCRAATEPPQNVEDVNNLICEEVPPTVYACLLVLLGKIEPCLDEEEKYLPKLLLDTFTATIERRCEGGVTRLAEITSVAKDSDCAQSLPFMQLQFFEQCLPQLTFLQELENPNFVLRKSNFCSDLKTAKKCGINILKQNCNDSVLQGKLLESSTEPFVPGCNENELD